MDGSTHITAETDDQVLDELAQLGLALARDLQQAALAAKQPEEKARLAAAFHKVARGVRQGIALKQKLVRDSQAFACEIAPKLVRAEAEAAERRRGRLQSHLERVLWDEFDYAEAADYYILMGAVREALLAEAQVAGFTDQTFEDQLAAYRERFRPDLWDFSEDDIDDADDLPVPRPGRPDSS